MTPTDYRANGLEVGVEHAPGLVVGVTDIITRYGFLLAKFTHPCHGRSPSSLNKSD
jgi:hypothetical protein